MKTLVRSMITIPLTLAGCWLYFASALVGEGVHLDPMPGWGMLIAGAALVLMLGGYFPIRTEKPERILAAIINAVLGLGGAIPFVRRLGMGLRNHSSGANLRIPPGICSFG